MQGAAKRRAVVCDCLCQGLEYLGCFLVSDEHFEHAIVIAVLLFCAPAFRNCSAQVAQQPNHARGEAEQQQKQKGLQEMFCPAMEGAREVACADYDETLG